MPIFEGRRVTLDEWHVLNGSHITQLHTGPNGENPAGPPELDAETGAPKSKKVARAGGQRSKRSQAAAKSAIADALGVKDDSPVLEDIDVSGLTEDTNEPE